LIPTGNSTSNKISDAYILPFGASFQSSHTLLRFIVNVDQYEFTVQVVQPVAATNAYHFRLLDRNGWRAPEDQKPSSWEGMTDIAAKNAMLAVRRVEPEADLRLQWGSNLTPDNCNALAKRELQRFPSLASALILVIGRTDGQKPPEIQGKQWSKPQAALLEAEVLLQRRFATVGQKLNLSDLIHALALLKEAQHDPLLKNFALTQQGVAYLRLAEDSGPGNTREYWGQASSAFGEVEKNYPTAKFYRLKAQTRLGAAERAELESLKKDQQAKCADLEAPFGSVDTYCASIVFGTDSTTKRPANVNDPRRNYPNTNWSPSHGEGAIGLPTAKEVRSQ
jgi:hypothetical protein